MFFCLLRANELTMVDFIHLEHPPGQSTSFTVTLPWRKQSKGSGENNVFHLFVNNEELYLCPLRALHKWLEVLPRHLASGPLIRQIKIDSKGKEVVQTSKLGYSTFLSNVRNALRLIGVKDDHLFGTHSFRRGGCQFLNMTWRWSIRQICLWGGWSLGSETKFNANVVLTYLLNDIEIQPTSKDRFMDPAYRNRNVSFVQ